MTLFIILVALAIFAIRNNTTWWLIVLPGTIVHETLHYVVGLVTGARPFNFNVVPNVTESSICYGSVDFENFNTFNATPTALAPLLAIPLALFAWPYVQGPHGLDRKSTV